MKLLDCLLVLIGNRGAIQRIATCRSAVWVGLLFVFVAAFAREYDQEYLVARPLFLLIPAGASLVVATAVFVALAMVGRFSLSELVRRGHYRQFVALFWMTAPLAWWYAMPYERYFDERDAVIANMLTLGVVSVWRVVLIIRITSVLFGTSSDQAARPILLVSDTILIIGLNALPFPLIQLMGGTSHSAATAQEAVRSVGCCTLALAIITWPVWAAMNYAATRLSIKNPWAKPPSFREDAIAQRGTWLLGIVALLAGAAPIYYAQLEQRAHYLQELRSDAQPAAETEAGLELLGNMRGHYWDADAPRTIGLSVQFGVWLQANGENWVTNQTDVRVNLMLEQVVAYPHVRASAPKFVAFLRRNQATLRPGIDSQLVVKILN
ncbi:MAG: hypothetical protein ACI89X_004326 [Planctomycetota bacterium]|jgi:hypothetical protein